MVIHNEIILMSLCHEFVPYLHFILSTTLDFTLHLESRLGIILQANNFLKIIFWMWIGYKFNLINKCHFWGAWTCFNLVDFTKCFRYVDNQGWIFGVVYVCKDPFFLKYE